MHAYVKIGPAANEETRKSEQVTISTRCLIPFTKFSAYTAFISTGRNAQALDMRQGVAKWADNGQRRFLSRIKQDTVGTEYGGINEVLCPQCALALKPVNQQMMNITPARFQ